MILILFWEKDFLIQSPSCIARILLNSFFLTNCPQAVLLVKNPSLGNMFEYYLSLFIYLAECTKVQLKLQITLLKLYWLAAQKILGWVG